MKIISYTALLYGVDYLEYAIRSVIEAVDEHHVIYSPIGAHGSRTDIPCPETRDELYAAAERGAGKKLRWHDAGPFAWEGQQRDSIHQYVPDADVILVVDADEVWSEGLADTILSNVKNWRRARIRVPIVHYWRSFYHCVTHDPAFPIRVLKPQEVDQREESVPTLPIHHFGYAQRPEIVNYKQLTHGHKGEWRKDDWFNSIFMANRQTDMHPVGSQYWNAETVDPFALGLPEWMREHPYAKLEVIE